MRKIGFLASAAIVVTLAACSPIPRPGPVGNRAVPEPTKSVDLQRYMGRWYEQFRYEASFQKDFEAVTADYLLNADGTVKVVNRGRKGGLDGKLKQSTGRAKIADRATNAKLKVSFFGPFYGDYWVLDHGDDYEWSIVGEPSGRYANRSLKRRRSVSVFPTLLQPHRQFGRVACRTAIFANRANMLLRQRRRSRQNC